MAADDNQALLLQVSADISKLEKAFTKASGTVDTQSAFMERRAKQLGQNIEGSLAGEGFGKAIEKVFDSSRLTVLEEGGAKLRVFGSALEPLGALGIGAAAGILAFSLAMERTEVSVEAAANIAKLAKEIGVSTDFLQEFNFAARQSDVDVKSADESIKALNVSLGAVQAGLAKKQLVNAFIGVGFTPAQLRQFHDVGDFLPVLADRIAAVGNVAEQAALAKRLGVLELLPLLQQGGDAFNKLAQEAKDLGIVLDASLIQQSEEAKKKLAEIADVTKAKSIATFAEFAATLIKVKEGFEAAQFAGLRFLAFVTGTTSLDDRIAKLQGLQTDDALNAVRNGTDPGKDRELASVTQELNGLRLARSIQQTVGRDATPSAASTAAKQLIPDKAKTAKADRTQSSIDASLAKEDQAHAALLTALLAQATDLATQLDLTRQITQAQKDRVDAETAKKIAEVAAAKDIKSSAKAGIEANYRKAADDEKAAIDAKAIRETLDLQLKNARVIVDFQAAQADAAAGILDAQAALAVTLKDRAALEAAALKLRQQAELNRAGQSIAEAAGRGDLAGTRREQENLINIQARQSQDSQGLAAKNAGPIADYLKSIQDLDTEFQSAGVQAAKDLSTALVQAGGDMGKFGTAVLGVLRNMLAQAATAALQKEVFGPLLSAGASLLGFADGTDFAPGGLAVVGERGKEVVNLPRGSQVIPNHNLSALANVAAPKGAQVTVLQPITADFRGAVVTEDLMANFKAYADSVGARAAVAGAQLGKQQAIGAIQTMSRNRLGRT